MRKLFALVLLAPGLAVATTESIVYGNIRVQVLSDTLIRIEEKGPLGFVDAPTFTVVNRNWPGGKFIVKEEPTGLNIQCASATLSIPSKSARIQSVRILSLPGKMIADLSRPVPTSQDLPSPNDTPTAWILNDQPRLIPPAWGATPRGSISSTLSATSGWDTRQDAPDYYVFLPSADNYARIRSEFLRLTGATPMPPKYALGLIDSRYHPYTDTEALAAIKTYRRKNIPLDVFVVDTDWRINGSHGYAVEPKYFPDMPGFMKTAKNLGVRLIFNDHPEPTKPSALDPDELAYRYNGLTGLMNQGLDGWWYDRNWHTHLPEPMPGIGKEVWGMRLYWDILQAAKPELRPFFMANVDGIDNGISNRPSHPAAHRFPVQWTGDTLSRWDFLDRGIRNMVNRGVDSMLPYVSEDLGGHVGQPDPEQYIRWIQYGAFSPIMRIHCTRGFTRYPWEFGPDAERIATEMIRMRYRLMPYLYTAARESFESGTPICRRLDLSTPSEPKAVADNTYLFGPDILVAPVTEPLTPVATSIIPEIQPGWQAEYFKGIGLKGEPLLKRTEREVDGQWGAGSPDPSVPIDQFSARYTTQLGPMPETGDYVFEILADDGVRLRVAGKSIIDAWKPHDAARISGKVRLERGKTYPVNLEYFEDGGNAICSLKWRLPSVKARASIPKGVFIPAGEWINPWTGVRLAGPGMKTIDGPLQELPMLVRAGALIAIAPGAFNTEQSNQTLTLESYLPSAEGETQSSLYEDDGKSRGYETDRFCRTALHLNSTPDAWTINIGAGRGTFAGQPPTRKWRIRAHLPLGVATPEVKLNGQLVHFREVPTAKTVTPFAFEKAARTEKGGMAIEIDLPAFSMREEIKLEIRRKGNR